MSVDREERETLSRIATRAADAALDAAATCRRIEARMDTMDSRILLLEQVRGKAASIPDIEATYDRRKLDSLRVKADRRVVVWASIVCGLLGLAGTVGSCLMAHR